MKRIAVIFLAIIFIIGLFGCSQTNLHRTNDLRNVPSGSKLSEDSDNSQHSTSNISSENSDSPHSSEQHSLSISSESNNKMRVHFLDVGQADCILIQMPDDKSMLIDAGNNADEANIVSYIKSLGINKIDILIGTHPHADHIGGMDAVINSFDIGKIYMPKVSNNTKAFERVLLAIKSKGLKVSSAKAGTVLDAGPSVKAEILAPNNTSYKELNNYSVVVRIAFGSTAFLFTGDAEKESEDEMLLNGFDVKSTVLKVGHHGSTSSTTAKFLKAVSPKYAVISTGEGNDYGHPHRETLDRLKKAKIQIYRTDKSGTIVFTSDGSVVKFDKDIS